MKEQRSFHRLNAAGEVVFKEKDIPNSSIIDISYNGIAIYSKKKIEIGKLLAFELKIDFVCEPIKCSGIIKYMSEKNIYGSLVYKIGIEFIDTEKNNIAFIIKRVQSVFAEQQKRITNSKSPDFIPY